MTLFSYEIFDAVARQGSFNKAAQQLHLTPSAISHAIAVMEEELGFALFNRGKNGVSMTSYGASLYPSIREVLNSDEALKQSIARLNGLEKGKVKLGAFNSVCAGLLPQLGAGEFLTPPFSPGYGDWSLAAQDRVLDLLQAPKRIGLTLTEGGMLVPEKSITALVGISDRPEEACGQKCMRCNKTDCPFRSAPEGEEERGVVL